MKEIVAFGKSMSDPIRVRILNVLTAGELCVCELVDILEINHSTLGAHLQTLRNSGVVNTSRRQKWVDYSIHPNATDAVVTAFSHFMPIGERIERDLSRRAARVRLRVDGCCVLGPGQLDREFAHA